MAEFGGPQIIHTVGSYSPCDCQEGNRIGMCLSRIHAGIQQISMESLLYARHCVRLGGLGSELGRHSPCSIVSSPAEDKQANFTEG